MSTALGPQETISPSAVDLSLMDEVVARYRGQRGAIIPMLQAAQAIYGYLPRPVLELIARVTQTSLSRVYGVATFYAQFYLQPRGRHVLKLCDGTACHVKGTPKLLTALQDAYQLEPGKTSADGQLTLEIVYCLGSCALAPVAVLDGQVMGHMRQEALLRQLRRRLGAGRETAGGDGATTVEDVHASAMSVPLSAHSE
ncbi:MAG: NAD(P)H-dependent oxidoreductase subunit E [Anaerolineae bacterium]|nr:NAD(P)H-dependent oxidoreductase subunit E [Anaerolineae bacterium]